MHAHYHYQTHWEFCERLWNCCGIWPFFKIHQMLYGILTYLFCYVKTCLSDVRVSLHIERGREKWSQGTLGACGMHFYVWTDGLRAVHLRSDHLEQMPNLNRILNNKMNNKKTSRHENNPTTPFGIQKGQPSYVDGCCRQQKSCCCLWVAEFSSELIRIFENVLKLLIQPSSVQIPSQPRNKDSMKRLRLAFFYWIWLKI